MERVAGTANETDALEAAKESSQLSSLTRAQAEKVSQLSRGQSVGFLLEGRNHGVAVDR